MIITSFPSEFNLILSPAATLWVMLHLCVSDAMVA
jgi:hypothetical protein